MFKGVYTALITPFINGQVSYEDFENLIDFQIKNDISGLVICGTTGEACTLKEKEQEELIKIAVKKVKNKNIKIIAGASAISTEESLYLSKKFTSLNVDGLLISTPPYNKPTQKGLYEHYKIINDNINIPIILYNVPGRTCSKLENKTIVELAKLKNIKCLKDATGDLALLGELKRDLPQDFTLLSGNDATNVGFNAMGGDGTISVISNIFPQLAVDLQQTTEKMNFKKAIEIQSKFANMNKLLYLESNPIPIKYACSLLDYGDGSLKLPLTILSENYQIMIKDEMKKF